MTVSGLPVSDLDLNEGKLTPKQQRALASARRTSSFNPDDRLFRDFDDYRSIYSASPVDLRAMRDMLRRDGTPRKLEQVLSLPIRSAPFEIRGRGPEADLVRENLGDQLPRIISQATSAISYCKAFFECTWKVDGGRVLYDKIAPRPAVSCEARWTDDGEANGFRQMLPPVAMFGPQGQQLQTVGQPGWDGWAKVDQARSFIYTHGTHREPVTGLSDLDVSLWCWDQILKITFFWCQYLEGQSLPRLGVGGKTLTDAERNADVIADAGASGVIPFVWPDEQGRRLVEVIESSGKGAGQFREIIEYFESRQTGSVLASFMDLAQQASTAGRGSNALSADQSEFFLGSRQAVAGELAEQIRDGLFRPLVTFNFGPDAQVPDLYIGPIGNRQVDRALNLLQSIMQSQHPTAPPKFTASLMSHVAAFLGLEEEDVATVAQEWAQRREERDDYQAQLDQTMRMNQTGPGGAGGAAAGVAQAAGLPSLPPKLAAVGQLSAGEQLTLDLAADSTTSEPVHTGGMVALLPDATSIKRLAVDHDKAEDPAALHLTVAYLGDDVTGLDPEVADELPAAVRTALAEAGITGPISARAFAHTTFNADGGADGDKDPCAVYGIGDTDRLDPLHRKTVAALGDVDGFDVPAQHTPYVPHVTAGYGMTAADLSYLGPVTFDRALVALGDKHVEIPLTKGRKNA